MENRKCLVIVTGASRGLGRCVALELARHVGAGSTFLLTSRSVDGLEETARLLRSLREDVQTQIVSMDNASPAEAEFQKFVDDGVAFAGDSVETAILVHNSGSLGSQGSKTTELSNLQGLHNYYNLNLFSVMILNAVFLRTVSSETRIVVNISSLCALQPMSTWSEYCTGKAARDMFFKVVALEEKSVRVLNYAPGPLDTEMVAEITGGSKTDEEVRKQFLAMKKEGKLLRPEDSAAKLALVLKADKYESGHHVDFFDVE